MSNPNVCEHGSLRRSCEICDLQAEINEQTETILNLKTELEAVKKENEQLKEWLECEGLHYDTFVKSQGDKNE